MELFIRKNITLLVLLIEAVIGLLVIRFVPCKKRNYFIGDF